MESVEGRCPACGSKSLFLAVGNHVTCGNLKCANPTAVADTLEDGKPLAQLLTAAELAVIDLVTEATEENLRLRAIVAEWAPKLLFHGEISVNDARRAVGLPDLLDTRPAGPHTGQKS